MTRGHVMPMEYPSNQQPRSKNTQRHARSSSVEVVPRLRFLREFITSPKTIFSFAVDEVSAAGSLVENVRVHTGPKIHAPC